MIKGRVLRPKFDLRLLHCPMQETTIPSYISALLLFWASYARSKLAVSHCFLLRGLIGGTGVEVLDLSLDKQRWLSAVWLVVVQTHINMELACIIPVRIRQEWIRQTQRTRDQWTGPSEHSVLCSEHFADVEPDFLLSSLPKTKRLKPGAIPTIFNRHGSEQSRKKMVMQMEQLQREEEELMKREKDQGYNNKHGIIYTCKLYRV